MDRCGTADIGRQARKSAPRDACASGKRFDDACRPRSTALRVAPGGACAASKALTVAQATLCGLLLAARRPPDAMTRLSMVRSPGLANDTQNSMPFCAFTPARNGCLIMVISVTRSAASISGSLALRPVTTTWRSAGLFASTSTTSSSGR